MKRSTDILQLHTQHPFSLIASPVAGLHECLRPATAAPTGCHPGTRPDPRHLPVDNLPFKGTFHFDEGYYYFRNLGDRVLLGGARNLAFTAETTTEMTITDTIQQELERFLREVILPAGTIR